MTQRLSVRNPRSGEIDHWITPMSGDQLAHQSNRLRAAQSGWEEKGLEHRIGVLQRWKQCLVAHRDELISALATDTGRWPESVMEFDLLISSIDRWCRLSPQVLAPTNQHATSIPYINLAEEFKAYPLVGVISPWNFPLLLSNIDTIPALLAGCAVIVKPSEVTPRFILPLLKTVASVPELQDLLLYLEGAGETGARVVELVDLICFTGSLETGRKVAEAAARQFIPACLELGGKDPAVVLSSANMDLATSSILWGSVVNAGQSCLSIERVYVASSIFDLFLERLLEKARQLNLAYPSFDAGQIGPIIDANQADLLEAHLRDADEKGATVRCGGFIDNLGGGLWCHPTVLTDVNHSMKVMTEETFGPIMPVMSFSSVEQAIQLANDSIYGLSASVFAEDQQEARSIARCLQAGAISINDAGLTSIVHQGEKNSFKFSGMGGSRMGPASLLRFLRKKAILIKTEPIGDPWWFDMLKGVRLQPSELDL